jgi:glycosyltransferase involved in cell wall biosynthesis
MINKKKVLIGYNFILHYRVPLFNTLSKKYDLTVLHSGKSIRKSSDLYNEIIVPVFKVSKIHFQPGLIKEIKNNKYDVVILLFDVAWVTSLIASFCLKKNQRLILWGSWITKNFLANKVRLFFSKLANGNIFYTYKSSKDFNNMGLDSGKIFIANNTFDVGNVFDSSTCLDKNSLIFVGSLDSRKQNDVLIRAFHKILPKIDDGINLHIIGSGTEYVSLVKLVNDLNMSERIIFKGKIEDQNLLALEYKHAIASISFGQAGLSVLQSLGFGVPFVTKKNAISGGEIFNIKHNHNGILCDDNIDDLQSHLLLLCTDKNYARQMGANAHNYYRQFCTMDNMAQGFIDAIENVQLANIDINV